MSKFAIFHINDFTPEKDLIGTSVISSYKKAYPDVKIIVVTHFPEIWLHNPDVFRVFRHGQTPFFYDDFVKDKNSKIFAQDPYLKTESIKKQKHLAEIWCDMCGVKHDGSLPKIVLTQREEEVAFRLSRSENNEPMLLIEPFATFKRGNTQPLTWPKDLPPDLAQKIVNYARSHGYNVVQVKNPNQPQIIGAKVLNFSLRLNFALIKHSQKRLFVDSAMQHVSAGMNLPAVVTWLWSHPDHTGYKLHKNYFAKIDTDLKNMVDSFSPQFDISGQIENSPANLNSAYNADEIINLLEL